MLHFFTSKIFTKLKIKSNKGKKIELANLDIIEQIQTTDILDVYTKNELNKIKSRRLQNSTKSL